jgi:predicted outer membrane repeat protein
MKKVLKGIVWNVLLISIQWIFVCGVSAIEINRYVKPSGTGKGTSWGDASGNINAALDAVFRAGSGTVYVGAGVYNEAVSIPDGSKNISLMGGYSEQDMETFDPGKNKVIIKGSSERTLFTIGQAVLTVGYNVKTIRVFGVHISGGESGIEIKGEEDVVVSHCTVSGCTNTGILYNGLSGRDRGEEGVTIRNCEVSQCLQGIHASWADIEYCVAHNNEGVGMNVSFCTLSNCISISNRPKLSTTGRAISKGGGIIASSSKLYRCYILNNLCDEEGGGVHISGSGQQTVLFQCIIANNTARDGGGIYSTESTIVESCTIINNKATRNGGGICIDKYGFDGFDATGTVLWGNKTNDRYEQYYIAGQKPFNIYNSVVQGGGILPELDKENGIYDVSAKNTDPDKPSVRLAKVVSFAGVATTDEQRNLAATQDYTPTAGSACIDRGGSFSNIGCEPGTNFSGYRISNIGCDRTTDIAGNKRVNRYDIGALEYQEASDTGTAKE